MPKASYVNFGRGKNVWGTDGGLTRSAKTQILRCECIRSDVPGWECLHVSVAGVRWFFGSGDEERYNGYLSDFLGTVLIFSFQFVVVNNPHLVLCTLSDSSYVDVKVMYSPIVRLAQTLQSIDIAKLGTMTLPHSSTMLPVFTFVPPLIEAYQRPHPCRAAHANLTTIMPPRREHHLEATDPRTSSSRYDFRKPHSTPSTPVVAISDKIIALKTPPRRHSEPSPSVKQKRELKTRALAAPQATTLTTTTTTTMKSKTREVVDWPGLLRGVATAIGTLLWAALPALMICILADLLSTAFTSTHTACLLYTSPSPRD